MHRCLEVADLLGEIVECVGASKPNNPPDVSRALRDLASLSRTCKVFYYPAAKCLWRRVADFHALIYKCLPEYLFKREEVVTSEGEKAICIVSTCGPSVLTSVLTTYAKDLIRRPTQAEWARADYYASLVTEFFPWWDDDLGVPTQDLDFLLSRGPNFLVFPNTRFLYWKTAECSALKYLPKLFLAPTILHIIVEVDSIPGWKIWTALVNHIASACPLLERLELTCHTGLMNDGMAEKDSSSLPGIALLKHLRHIDVGELPLTEQALNDLGGLPSLQYLSCKLPTDVQTLGMQLPDPNSCFTSLLSVKLRVEKITPHILACLKILQPREWAEITFTMLLPNTEQYSDLLGVFCTGKHAGTLEALRVEARSMARFPSGQYAPPVAGGALFPTRGAPNLRELRLVGASFMITDDELQRLAQGWPRLQVLALEHRHREREYSCLTVSGLRWLALCPSLEHACLEFDARVLDSRKVQALLDGLTSMCPLKRLTPCRSPVANPLGVAAFLCELFRGLEYVTAHQEPRVYPIPRKQAQWTADTQGWKVVGATVASRPKTRKAETT